MSGIGQTPEQAGGTPQLDVQALLRQRLQQQLAGHASGPMIRAATSAEVPIPGAPGDKSAASPTGVLLPPSTAVPPAATEKGEKSKVDTGVNVTVTTGSGRRFGGTLMVGAVLGAGVYGFAAKTEHLWPFKPDTRPTAATALQHPGKQAAPSIVKQSVAQHPTQAVSNPAPIKGSTVVSVPVSSSPTSSTPSGAQGKCATPNTSLGFTPTSIPEETRVTGTVTDLRIPLSVNYQRPGDTKTTYRLSGAFGIEVEGDFSMSVGAPAEADSQYPAITYDQAKSTEIGKVVVAIDGGYLVDKLSLAKVTATALAPALTSTDPTQQGAELSKYFAKHMTPAVNLPPREALALYQSIVGNPSAQTDEAKQGLQGEMAQDGGAALTKILQSAPYSGQIAAVIKASLVPTAEQQMKAACIPEGNIADVGQYSDFSKLPDISGQYPTPTDKVVTVDTKHIELSQGQPASGKHAAVPPTIVIKPAAGS